MRRIVRLLPWVIAESTGRLFTPIIPWATWHMNLPCPDEVWRRTMAGC